MAAEGITHFVFVDLENVPSVDLGLVEGKPVHVSLLIGKNQKKLDLALVRQIHRLGNQVELVEVGASGHNALDLTLAYYLGKTAQPNPTAQFHIVSKDKDFDPMISHLVGKNVKVARCDAISTLPFLAPRRKTAPPFPPTARAVAPPKAAAPVKPGGPARKQPADRRAKIIARLRDPSNPNRPASLKSLQARIKTDLGSDFTAAAAEHMIRELRDSGAISVGDKEKVTYAEQGS